jgi:Tfp pilus assembly protein PilF
MAEEHLQMAVKQDPHFAEAHDLLGTLYERIGQLPRSRYHFRRSMQIREESKKDKDDASSEDS